MAGQNAGNYLCEYLDKSMIEDKRYPKVVVFLRGGHRFAGTVFRPDTDSFVLSVNGTVIDVTEIVAWEVFRG